MELSSPLLCQNCRLTSLTEESCSHCRAPLPTQQLEFSTDTPGSPHTVAPTTKTNSQNHFPGQTNDNHIFHNRQNLIPPDTKSPKVTNSSDTTIYHPIFWGRGRTLFGIFIVNTLYTLLTLGIYSFWGRVRIRQFLSNQTSFAKIRFSYHGTGQELIKGWSKAFVIFGIPYMFFSLVPIIWDHIPIWIPNLIISVMVLCFIPVAVVGSHRYRLSRTAFGAIRFSFRGRVKDYMKIWFTGSFLTFMTAGLYYPFFENARRDFLVTHSFLGNRHFSYYGTGTALLGIYGRALGVIIGTFLVTVIGLAEISGIPLTLEFHTHMADWLHDEANQAWQAGVILGMAISLLWSWWYLQLSKQRYFWNQSTFQDASFQFSASTWNLVELRLTNFLLLILTFGLAWPWVHIRNLHFLYYYLGLQGPLDIHEIEQDALDASPTGEELAGYFDAGFDLG